MSESRAIRVVVVDDHAALRAGITQALDLEDDLVVVGEAADGEEALRVCGEVHPDVVLMDLGLPRLDGLSATRALQRYDPVPQVLVLTASIVDEHLKRETREAGAVGYLQKDITLDVLFGAVRAAGAGRSRVAPGAIQVTSSPFTAAPTRTPPTSANSPLERERAILALVVAGLPNREIADRLNLTPAAVRYSLLRLCVKLGVASRTELAARAVQRQPVEQGDVPQ